MLRTALYALVPLAAVGARKRPDRDSGGVGMMVDMVVVQAVSGLFAASVLSKAHV